MHTICKLDVTLCRRNIEMNRLITSEILTTDLLYVMVNFCDSWCLTQSCRKHVQNLFSLLLPLLHPGDSWYSIALPVSVKGSSTLRPLSALAISGWEVFDIADHHPGYTLYIPRLVHRI